MKPEGGASSAIDDFKEPAYCVLLLPATPRDGLATTAVLKKLGICCETMPDLDSLLDALSRDIGAVVMSELAVAQSGFDALLELLSNQPAWSDIPVVVTLRNDIPDQIGLLLRRLTNVTLLDRPTSVRTLTSAVQAALRARRRQYEIRSRIEALERAHEALRESDRRKDIFLATLAHELRNPLSPIRNAAQILSMMGNQTERLPELAQMIQRQTATMALLLDDLLDIARITNGKLELRQADVTMEALVDAAVEASRPQIDARKHVFMPHVETPDAVLHVDSLRISQVLTNLLTNAAKYTDPGGRIELDARLLDGVARFTVRDNGIGVEPTFVPQLFEMFHQLEGTLNRAQGGLGIGLAITRSLVEMHGGTVIGESAGRGQGTTFRVAIPARTTVVATIPETGSTTTVEASPGMQQLMVVDDNVDAAVSLSLSLEMHGYAVDVAHSGRDALARGSSLRPAAMLLDIGMPEMDGYELARRVRREAWGAGVLLVAVTGWGQPDDQKRAHEAGFDVHLTKPVALARVTEILTQRLARAAA